MDLSGENYYYLLKGLEKGSLNVTISVDQNGKKLTETKILQVEECATLKDIVEETVDSWVNFIKENKTIFIYGSLIFFALIMISYALYKTRQ